jgi:O-antigen/teichoic acid export membrane protein
LSAAVRKIGPILIWAIIAATVGMVLRTAQQRLGFIGRIAVSLIGAGWSLATFFVVPVLVLEDYGPGNAVTRSIEIFKKTWGETLAGGVTIGLAALCSWMTLIAVAMLLFAVHLAPVAIAVGAIGALALAVIFPALDGIFIASLYRFATAGPGSSVPESDALARTFTPVT